MKNKIAYIGCISLIGVISTEFGVIGILPQIADYYHITIDKAGVLLSAFAMVAAIAGPFLAIFTSRINRKKLIAISMTDIFNYWNSISLLSPILVITAGTAITCIFASCPGFCSCWCSYSVCR